LHVPQSDPSLVFSGSADSSIGLLHLTEHKLVSKVACSEVPYTIKSDGNLVFATGGSGSLMVGEAYSAVAPTQFNCHDGVVSCLRVVNHRVITGGLDG